MRKIKSKKNLFIFILLIVISSTVAYLYSTDTFQNIFVAASYKVTVTETFESPDNWKPGDTTPKTATLKNEGTVPIKVRVKLEESWKDSNNQDLPLQHNDENVAIINFSNEDDYIYKDGYYYYDLALNPGDTTSSIIESVTFNPNYSGTVTCVESDDSTHTCSSSESGYEGGTYKLTLTIEGVQEDYYVQAWGLSGIVERKYLYNVLKSEAESNGLAREYSGEHHDSFTEEPSQKIYHWYASNDSQGTQILNKNNVIFGGQCWQMIRTTDTGGVKMIYNGEAENSQCLNTRGTHVGYQSGQTQLLNSNYWYGTNYEYDSTTQTFTLSGITEQVTWNATTGPNLIGKYTCKSEIKSASCSVLFLIEEYYDESRASTTPIGLDVNYSNIGNSIFNRGYLSAAFLGYKYGDVYNYETASGTLWRIFTESEGMLSPLSLKKSFWYANSIDYGNLATDKYSLVDAYQVSGVGDYTSLVGKYTFRNSSDTYTGEGVYYIVGVDGSTMYYKYLSGGNLLDNYEPIIFGDSITDNGDGTFTINNTTSITLLDWYNDYASYENKYTCNTSSNNCTSPRYITKADLFGYTYLNASEKIMVGKSRSGTTLVDVLLLRKDEWYTNYYSSYSDYKYTCYTTNSVCTKSNLEMIVSIGESKYEFAPNHFFGSSVTWDGTNYNLVDPIEMDKSTDLNEIATHRYICPNYGEKTCKKVGYIYYYSGSGGMDYIELKNGVTSFSDAMANMFTKNTKNSEIKSKVDAWYKHFLLEDYDNYIEDTIFCNDRHYNYIDDLTNKAIYFKENTPTTDLSCINETDKFSVSNNDALLDYKVGLMSSPEMNILNNKNARKSGQSYWLGSAVCFLEKYSFGSLVDNAGNMDDSNLNTSLGIRPAISLKPGIEYTDGDGSMQYPYIVKMD